MADPQKKLKTGKLLRRIAKLAAEIGLAADDRKQLRERLAASDHLSRQQVARLEQLDKAFAQLTVAIAELQEQQRRDREQLDLIAARPGNGEGQQQKLLRHSESLESRYRELAASLAATKARLENDTGVSVLHQQLAQLEDKQSKQRVALGQHQAATEQELSTLQHQLGQFSARMAALLGRVDDVNQQLGAVQIRSREAEDDHKALLGQIQQQLTDLAHRVEAALEQERTKRLALRSDQDAHASRLSVQEEALEKLAAALRQLASESGVVRAQRDAQQHELPALRQHYQDQAQQLRRVEELQAAQQDQLKTVRQSLEQHRTEFQALRTSTERMAAAGHAVAAKVQNLRVGGAVVAAAILLVAVVPRLMPPDRGTTALAPAPSAPPAAADVAQSKTIAKELRSIDRHLERLPAQLVGLAKDRLEERVERRLGTVEAQVQSLEQRIEGAKPRDSAAALEAPEDRRSRQPPIAVAAQSPPQHEPPAASSEGRDPWAKAAREKHFTIQLVGVSDKASLRAFVQRHRLPEPLAYATTRFQERPWYVLLSGDYSSAAAATGALARLPPELRAQGPWIRRIPPSVEDYGPKP